MRKFYSGNSIDQPKNDRLKIKNINLDYYGIKARSSSRRQRHANEFEGKSKKTKREHIMIDNSISNMIFDSIIINEKGSSSNTKVSNFNNHFVDSSQRHFKTIYENDKENLGGKLKSLCDDYNKKRGKNKNFPYTKNSKPGAKLK